MNFIAHFMCLRLIYFFISVLTLNDFFMLMKEIKLLLIVVCNLEIERFDCASENFPSLSFT